MTAEGPRPSRPTLEERFEVAFSGVFEIAEQLAAADDLISELVAENDDLRARLALLEPLVEFAVRSAPPGPLRGLPQ